MHGAPSLSRIALKTSSSRAPLNGGRPHNKMYSTAPADHTSARAS